MSEQKTILIVDDTPANIAQLRGLLKGIYKIKIANNGFQALRIMEGNPAPDLVLLDIMMPEMDGYSVCERLRANLSTQDIPIIFLTAKSEISDETKGLSMGAVDYITKPISPPIVLARVRNHLMLKDAQDSLKQQNELLEEKIEERTRKLGQLQDVIMVAMGALAEARDPETGNHIRRTQHYVKLLATRLRNHHRFTHFLTPETITLLYKTAPLHDIGKVGVPDHILLKPGRLTAEEFEEMKLHTVYGRNALVAAESVMNEQADFLELAKEIVYSHQEKWDGSGYPEGLAGEAIPISARLMAVADVYDALISLRVYKPALPHDKAVAIICKGKGSHFDPDMVEAFLEVADDFYSVATKFVDTLDEVEAKNPLCRTSC